jgi:pyrroline-5-carboxylate reductase
MDSQTKRTGDLLDLIAAGRLIGFVGAGKLAGSVIRGLVLAKFCSPGEIIASEPNESLRAALRYEVGIHVTEKNAEVAGQAELIFIGVKPAVVLPVLREIASLLNEKIVISLAAGVRLEAMEPIANARFMRAMTNTPSAICRAATAIARGSRTTNDDVDLARKIFSAIGVVVEVNEEQIDAVTALAGSGPAFVYTVIEALAEGGKKMGLAPDTALTLATQTVLGAAQLASESKLSPEELRKLVVTPGGTTAAGLAALEKLKTAEGLIAAVQAATKRGQEMAKENL